MKFRQLVFIAVSVLIMFSCVLNNEGSADFYTPGEYPLAIAYKVVIPFQNASILVTLDSVEVNNDLTVVFNFTWGVSVNPGYSITKYSDYQNNDMNIRDNFGNTYYMINAIDAAAADVTMVNGETCSGSFIFDALPGGITTIFFHDDDNDKYLIINQIS